MKRAPEVKRLRALDALGVRTRVFVGIALGATLLSFVLNALGRSPLLLFVVEGGALAVLAALLGAVITYDGQSTRLGGLALIGLYPILAVSFW